MKGLIINLVAILIGGLSGNFVGEKLSSKYKDQIMSGLALSILVVGMESALKGENFIQIILAMVLGLAIGTYLDIESQIEGLGNRIQKVVNKKDGDTTFVEGFVSASLILCVGSLTIIGALNAGLMGDNSLLITKSVFDGITAFILASTLGIGVMFSGLPLIIYEGAIFFLARVLKDFFTPAIMANINGVGGILILAIGFNMLRIRDFKSANMIPAIFLGILFAAIWG
ncbi:DUF554 domain-containing protein [Peptoniphilus sp.]|uniref:DUF554 domain-containing protein n=1 Tax=Peptoniphilus sp. TaxID=1971214 RepID=UPI003991B2F1